MYKRIIMKKSVKNIFTPPPVHFVGDGFRVHNFIPGVPEMTMKRMDPFILLDYNSKFYFSPSSVPRGVGIHPHRGFETVSIAYKGKVAHRDSAGNSGVIGEGDVQWMTAASGILHEEFHEKEFSEKGGIFHMVQLWVNLPSKFKMIAPKYQAILNSQMGKYLLPDAGGVVEIISGSYKGIDGPAFTFSPVNLFNVKLLKDKKANISFPKEYNTGLLVIEGKVKVNEKEVAENNFVLFGNDGDEFIIDSIEDSIVLVMSGKPLNEPIAAAGPFVMNTREELIKAYDDYESGKFTL